ncbi:MAG: adenylate kinase [Candidatus Obscuribacterales bacterium]|nr:adenylate kinase [Candidatus Obscuribacterales bacterium]
MEALNNIMRILFLGAPGSGKGTQCKKLADKTGLLHLSSGDMLREATAKGTEAGQLAKGFMDKGQLVPDDVLIKMFEEKLSSPECAKGFILDGFPRNLAQAKSLDALLEKLRSQLNAVINLQIDDHLLTERITGRRVCSNKTCNAVYHMTFAPPAQEGRCDLCGSALYQRSDDKEELVKERLSAYHSQTEPLIDFYDAKLLLRTVDAQGKAEVIFADILKTLDSQKKTSNRN